MKSKYKYFILIVVLLLSISFNYKSTSVGIDYKNYYLKNVLEDSYNYDSNSYNAVTTAPPAYIDEVVNGYHVIIEDDAALLTYDESQMLFEKMKKVTKYGNVAFKTINHNSNSTVDFASRYYHTKFSNASGTLFLIDMQNRMIYIFSDGSVYNTITHSKAEIITDNVYRYASEGKYYECAEEAYSEIYTLLVGNKIKAPMKYITNAILSLVIAALIGFLLSIRKASLKAPKDKDIVNLLNKKVEVVGEFVIEKKGQRRVYSPISSDSSSGSSGGSSGGSSSFGGGGGGSSGGGGGHRF